MISSALNLRTPSSDCCLAKSNELCSAKGDTKKDYEAFYQEIGISIDELADLVSSSSIHDVWEEFGFYRTIRRSARPEEFGILEISDCSENYSLSFMLPFDADGKLLGAGRVVLNTKEDEVECRDIDSFTSSEIFAEVAAELQEDLSDISWELASGNDLCTADHSYSLFREKALAENSTQVVT